MKYISRIKTNACLCKVSNAEKDQTLFHSADFNWEWKSLNSNDHNRQYRKKHTSNNNDIIWSMFFPIVLKIVCLLVKVFTIDNSSEFLLYSMSM